MTESPERFDVQLPELFSAFRERRTRRQTVDIALRRTGLHRIAALLTRLKRA
jgi:hypothetical protein